MADAAEAVVVVVVEVVAVDDAVDDNGVIRSSPYVTHTTPTPTLITPDRLYGLDVL